IPLALTSFIYGSAFGLLPIGYVVFAAIFLYQISLDSGQFEIMKASIANLTADRRLQAVIIAFSFGALVEGAAGFGTPVAVSAALMVGLGFKPFYAAALCLIANTAPVAFGSVGTPLLMLETVTGIPLADLSAMNGRILPITAVLIPAWLVWAMVGWRKTKEVLPALLVSGVSFAITQFLWSNYIDGRLVDIVGGAVSLICTALFMKVWKPASVYLFEEDKGMAFKQTHHSWGRVTYGWLPFLILGAFVLMWGWPSVKAKLDTLALGPVQSRYLIDVPLLDRTIQRVPPIVPEPAVERAQYNFNWLSATGSGVMIAAALTALTAGLSFRQFLLSFQKTCRRMVVPLLAITPMLGLAYTTRYSGVDAILGLAFTKSGPFFYPFFAPWLGWLGVALTGSDTSSNALFGSLQRITAEQLKLDPVLITSANSAGGVMGKMVDAQSIVVAATATNQVGTEGQIFRFVMWHSIALATITAIIVMLYAHVFPQYVPHDVKFIEFLF
ncbi:MAG TPA: L-lactate permease, partial [Terriglobia bacterium]|nr:L-lactate permease [Terriglobia bacterium]